MSGSGANAIQLVDDALIEATLARARNSPRLRANHNFHPSDAEGFHRFLNALVRGSYVAPHRHVTPPKAEAFLALRGELACFVFDDDGRVSERLVLGRNGRHGVDFAAGVWHSIAALTPEVVAYEAKPGPWDPATDKEFAPWAPREGDPRASAYLARLLDGLG
jgi:cupin fold WbuC family metalloprotein